MSISPTIAGPFRAPVRITIDRKPTSIERLSMRLIARALSRRRRPSVRLIALAILLPAGLIAITVKSIERLPGLAISFGIVAYLSAVACVSLWMAAHIALGDPITKDLAKHDMARVSAYLINASRAPRPDWP